MITHTEAMETFNQVMNEDRGYPYNHILKVNQGRFPILERMAMLWVYFKHIGEHKVENFEGARKCFFAIISFLPDYAVNRGYGRLLEYFSQGLNYTPINRYSPSLHYFDKNGRLF